MNSQPNVQIDTVAAPQSPIQETPRPEFRSLKLELLEERVAPSALWTD
jgi:hypothetical protein